MDTTTEITTRRRIEENKRLLAETRHLIRLSRRILDHPSLKISGASDSDEHLALDVMVRAMLTVGSLVPLRSKIVWAGHGSGKACCVCGKPVNDSEIEYQADEGGSQAVGCHLACFKVWQDESRRFRPDARAERAQLQN
jgi:hypothetical protein